MSSCINHIFTYNEKKKEQRGLSLFVNNNHPPLPLPYYIVKTRVSFELIMNVSYACFVGYRNFSTVVQGSGTP